MRIVINKTTLVILFIAIAITAILVFILKSIRSPLTAHVKVESEQIRFDLDKNRYPNNMSILNANLWANRAKISSFKQVQFRISPSAMPTDLLRFCDGNLVTISQASLDGSIAFVSNPESFSLRDMFLKGNASLVWRINEATHYIIIKNSNERNPSGISVVFSTGDSIEVQVYNCTFLDRNGEILYKTKPGDLEVLTFPMSSANSGVTVLANFDSLDLEIEMQDEVLAENLILLRGLNIKNVQFVKQERMTNGEIRDIDSIIGGSIRRLSYSSNDWVKINKGDLLLPVPNSCELISLSSKLNGLESEMRYLVKSFRVGNRYGAKTELVKSKLDILKESPTFVAVYGVALLIFGLLTKLVVEKKSSTLDEKEESNE